LDRTYCSNSNLPTNITSIVVFALSPEKRLAVVAEIQKGLSVREIGCRTDVSKSTVQRIRDGLPNIHRTSKVGRPDKLSEQTMRLCIRGIITGSYKSASAIATELKKNLGIDVSERTVRRILNNGGLKALEKQKKPKLSAKNVRARLDFARSHRDWTVSDWEHVIWSDETKINRFYSGGRAWCWIRDTAEKNSRHIKETVKYGGGSVIIWGCMTTKGPGFMCKIDGIMDKELYLAILQGELLQTFEHYEIDLAQSIFQHDNDPKHKAKTVQNWLNEQPFSVMAWPPQSPDLSPIEHLWAILKRRLNEYERPPDGIIELWERIQDTWEKIDEEQCKRLIVSMPARIQAVLKVKGKWTCY
jgi:transposase